MRFKPDKITGQELPFLQDVSSLTLNQFATATILAGVCMVRNVIKEKGVETALKELEEVYSTADEEKLRQNLEKLDMTEVKLWNIIIASVRQYRKGE